MLSNLELAVAGALALVSPGDSDEDSLPADLNHVTPRFSTHSSVSSDIIEWAVFFERKRLEGLRQPMCRMIGTKPVPKKVI